MNGVPQRQLLDAIRAEKGELEHTLAEIDRFVAEHDQKREDVKQERDRALLELAAVLLPALTGEALAEAVRRTGCQPLLVEDPLARMAAERARLEARLAELEADPRYRDRELLRAPRTGTLVRHLEELDEFRAPLARVVEQAAHPRLERLLELGYGTDAYAVGWWRLSYYADWKAADELVERFPGKDGFGAVRDELLEARRSLEVYDAQLGELRAEVAEGEALEGEQRAKTEALATLPETTLAAARQRIAQHLLGLELADLADRLADSPDLALLWKKASGLSAKLEYLDKIVDQQLRKPREELRAQVTKLAREEGKWSRPKYAHAQYPGDQFERRFVGREGRSRRVIERYRKTYNTVYMYDRWDRPGVMEELLWWDVMTDGRFDGSFIPQVSSFHHAHPGYHYAAPTLDRDEDAAAAQAALEGHGVGPDLLHHDAS